MGAYFVVRVCKNYNAFPSIAITVAYLIFPLWSKQWVPLPLGLIKQNRNVLIFVLVGCIGRLLIPSREDDVFFWNNLTNNNQMSYSWNNLKKGQW